MKPSGQLPVGIAARWNLPASRGALIPAAPESIATSPTASVQVLFYPNKAEPTKSVNSPVPCTDTAAAQNPGGHLPLKICFAFNELLLFTRLPFPCEAEAATSLVKRILGKLI